MQEIANTEFYTLSVDDAKRRVYNTVTGSWGDLPEMSQFMEDWENVIRQISDGYTMLTDASDFHLFSTRWAVTTLEIRKKLVRAGIKKIAQILPRSTLLKLQFGSLSMNTGVETKMFSDWDEAEIWLDSDES
jgi:hypothetical protein